MSEQIVLNEKQQARNSAGDGGLGGQSRFKKKARAHLATEEDSADAASWERAQLGYHFAAMESPSRPRVTPNGDTIWHVQEEYDQSEQSD